MATNQQADATVAVHQALHGYQDGHRLLQASVDLASTDRRMLARQTDHPDAGKVKGWDALLVGNRLPSGLFALSMTWPAWEMPRPGCVWTHSLLLNPDSLLTVKASALLACFRRPQGPEPDLGAYRHLVLLQDNGLSSSPPSKAGQWASALFWALYEPPSRPVRVTKMDLPDPVRHRLLLDSWLQAWPTLRSSITFCDAPKTPRTIDERPYELQLHQSTRVEAGPNDVRILRGIPDASPPSWAKRLVQESIRRSGLSDFLVAYGSTLEEDRGLMCLLVNLYLEHEKTAEDSEAETRAVESIANALPSPSVGRSLKQELLNPQGPPVGTSRQFDEVGLLRGLVSTKHSSALSVNDMDIPSRARNLARRSPAGTQAVLSAIDDFAQPIARAFLTSILDELDAKILKSWAREDPEGVQHLLGDHTELLFRPEIWSALDTTRLWGVAATCRKAEQRSRILLAAIKSGADLDAQQILQRWRNAGQLLLSLLVAGEVQAEQIDRFFRLISEDAIIEQVRNLPVSDRSRLVQSIEILPTSVVCELPAEALKESLKSEVSIRQLAAIVAAGLERSNDSGWAGVSVAAYDQIAGPALRDELGESKERFAHIEPSLPSWDVFARIAKAMSRALKGKAWSSTEALAIQDKEAFRALIEADERAGLARRLVLDATQDLVPIEGWQSSVLSKTIAERADRDALETFIDNVGKIGRTIRKLLP